MISKSESQKRYYEKHKKKILAYQRDRYAKQRVQIQGVHAQYYVKTKKDRLPGIRLRYLRRKIKVIQYMGGVCEDCQGSFNPCVYDFHHVDGTKEHNVSHLLRGKWENIINELKKCVMLCANCHRLRHFKYLEN